MMELMLIAVLLSATVECTKTPLYFSYITTFTGDYVASGAIPMVDRALEQINSRTDILENYTLNYTTILDSECRSTPALDSFLYHFKNTSQPTYISTLCCGCSSATIPVASISHHWNIPQVSFSAADTVLKDKKTFKSLFRALPSFEFKAEAYAQLMKEFGWKQMVMIFQEEVLFSKVKTSLENIYEVEGWNLLEISLESYLHDLPYDHIFDQVIAGNHKIIVLNCYMDYSILFLCEAYHRGMLYPEYVFMLLGKFHNEWWKHYKFDETECSIEEISKMINGSLSIAPEGNYISESNSMTNTISGEDAKSFLQIYYELLDHNQQYRGLPEIGIVGVAYDAIWSLAIGLDIASKKIAAGNDSGCGHLPGDLVPLEQFDYYNERLGCIMTESMEEVSFTGVTRDFAYVDGGPIDNVYLVNQERFKENMTVHEVLVGKIFVSNQTNLPTSLRFLSNENVATLWGSDTSPYDGSAVPRFVRSSIILQAICYSVSSLGLVFVALCTAFNIVFRNRKIVKLASPNLNYILLIGSALMYLSVYLYSFSLNSPDINAYTIVCNIEFLVFSLGYTTCFAVSLSKQWRVYYIFNNPTAKKKTIKDHILLIIIAIVVVIDLFIVLVGVFVPQIRIIASTTQDNDEYTTTEEDGILHQNFVIVCSNKFAFVWLVISFLYKASLQIVALFMAFHTRKVKIKALNDSKEITAIIYINSIVLTLLVVVEFGFHSSYNEVYAALFSVGIIIAASLFSGIIFIPKMVGLYFDPKGNNVFNTSSSSSKKKASDQLNHYQGYKKRGGNGGGCDEAGRSGQPRVAPPGNTVAVPLSEMMSESELQLLRQQLQFPQPTPPPLKVMNFLEGNEVSLSTSPEERTTVVVTDTLTTKN